MVNRCGKPPRYPRGSRQPIIPIRRAEGSGDTFIFTQFLTFSDSTWADNYGYGTTINWPAVPGSLEATGNDGMAQVTQKTAYSVAYIGVSYSAEIAKARLGTAWLENQAGKFLLPTKEAVQAAAACLGSRTPPDERLCIAFAPGEDAYPPYQLRVRNCFNQTSVQQAYRLAFVKFLQSVPLYTLLSPPIISDEIRVASHTSKTLPPGYHRKIDDKDDWAQGARMRIVGRGYKAGRFTYVGNAALSPPPDTDTSPGKPLQGETHIFAMGKITFDYNTLVRIIVLWPNLPFAKRSSRPACRSCFSPVIRERASAISAPLPVHHTARLRIISDRRKLSPEKC